jgi:hypothetical protein
MLDEPVHDAAPMLDEPVHDNAPVHAKLAHDAAPALDKQRHDDVLLLDEPVHDDALALDEPIHDDLPMLDEPAHDDAPVPDEPAHDDTPAQDEQQHDDAPVYAEPAHDDAPVLDEQRQDDANAAAHHAAIAAVFREMRLANCYPRSHSSPHGHMRALAISFHNHELSSRMPLAPERAAEVLRYVQVGRQPVASFWQRVAHSLLQAQLVLWAIVRGIRNSAAADSNLPQHVLDITRHCDVTEKTALNMAQSAERQAALVHRFGIGVACVLPARLGMGYVASGPSFCGLLTMLPTAAAS